MALGITAFDRLKWLGLARATALWGEVALYTVGDAPRGVEIYGEERSANSSTHARSGYTLARGKVNPAEGHALARGKGSAD